MEKVMERVNRKETKKVKTGGKLKAALLLLGLLTALLFQQAQGQTLPEWFSQKKTQKEYLIRQIAALQLYAGYLKNGYEIVHTGLTAIADIKKGEFGLHRDYFGSLATVSPALKTAARAEALRTLQQDILADYGSVRRVMTASGFVSDEEAAYVTRVYARLLQDCAVVLEDWIAVGTPGKLEMKDGERLERMNKLEKEMEDDRAFSRHFAREALQLAAARKAGDQGLKTLGVLTGE